MAISIPKPSLLLRPYSLHNFSSASHPPSADSQLPTAVASILTHHRSKRRWSALLSLYPSGFTASQFSHVALEIRNNPHLLLRFFLFTTRRSLCNHDLRSYSTLIHILARSRLKTRARELIRLALRAAPGDTESKHLKLFESLARTYNQCGSAPFVFDLLVKSCLDMQKIDGSVEIVRLLKSRGISPQVSTCNQLIWGVSKCKGAYEGYEVYKEVFCGTHEDDKKVVGVRPNVHTFNSLMVCFYREGAPEKVEELWSEMERLGCCANAYSYAVLMAALCEEGRMGDAEKLWEEMRVRGLEPDAVAYNTMIGGLCEKGDVERAEQLFKEMGLSGICEKGDVERAEQLFKEMGLSGIKATSLTYEHLIKGYCNLEDADSAMAVYKDMSRRVSGPVVASTVEMLIRLLCRKNEVLEALRMMREPGFHPTGKSYECLIRGLCKVENVEEAFRVQAEMVGKGFVPNKEIYDAFIEGYMGLGNEEMAAALRKEVLETQGPGLQRD